MDSNPIHQPSPAKKMKSSFLYYVELLMISRAGWWTGTPSATPLQPKKWNAHFWILFNFWWLGGLVDGLEPHPPPLSTQKNEMLIFGLRSLLMIDWASWWTWTPSATSSPAKKNEMLIFRSNTFNNKMKCFWWSAWLVNGLKAHLPPLSSHKKWNAHFCITFNFWCWPDWSMDSNPIHHPSPAKKMKSLFLYYVELLMLSQLMDSNPICQPSPAKKMKCSLLDFVQLLMISQAGRWTQTPSSTPLQPKKWNAHFCITFNIWCWPDWSMDLNPIHHSSPAKNMKCSFLGYIQLLMISWTGRWTQTPSTTPLQPKKWNAHFWIMFTSDDQPGWLMDSNPICHPSPDKKNEMLILWLDFWWLARLVNGLHPPPLSTQKNEMLIFGLRSLLMIDWASWWTWTPSATPLLRKKWNADFSITFNIWWSAWLVNGLKVHLPQPSPAIKNEMLIFVLHSTSDVGQAGWWTQTPSTTPLQPKKWNACFCITFNFWW